jgi:nicotinate-nucleotide adenylyltransferase
LPASKNDMPVWLQGLVKNFRADKGVLSTGRKLFFVKLNDVDISASDIRRKIRRDENVLHLLPSQILDYIKQQKLYDKSDVLVSDYTEFAKFCAQVINSKGGLSINAYDLRELVQPAEFAVVASGTSTRHTRALSEYIIQEAKQRYGIYPQSTEGQQEGRWIVVDFGALMVHLFYDFVRNEYRIEELWQQGKRISI